VPLTWLVVCRVLNLPPNARDKPENMLLNFICPGPKEPKDLAILKEMEVDELKLAYRHGVPVTTWDGHEVLLRIKVISFVYDYHGIPKFLRTAQSPAKIGACQRCHQRGFGAWNGKTLYPGTTAQRQAHIHIHTHGGDGFALRLCSADTYHLHGDCMRVSHGSVLRY